MVGIRTYQAFWFWVLFILVIVVLLVAKNIVFAQSISPNYQINEDFIGGGGLIESNSTNYSAQDTIGETGIGNSVGTNYQTNSGFQTTSEPRLSFTVDTSSINFGTLSIGSTATATSTFSVLNYTSHGYIVITSGSPPSNGGYTLAGMGSTGPSSSGTEQFGINLKANTSPTSFGAEAVQVPDNTFSFGEAAANYNSANNYRYVAGESIARSVKTSGQTNFTVSYIVNASTTTAGGAYSGGQTLICIGTY